MQGPGPAGRKPAPGLARQSLGDVARPSGQGGAARARRAPAVARDGPVVPGALLQPRGCPAGKSLPGSDPAAGCTRGCDCSLAGRRAVPTPARLSRPRPAWRTATRAEAALDRRNPPHPSILPEPIPHHLSGPQLRFSSLGARSDRLLLGLWRLPLARSARSTPRKSTWLATHAPPTRCILSPLLSVAVKVTPPTRSLTMRPGCFYLQWLLESKLLPL